MLKEYRRALHEIPELDWDVEETGNYLKSVLAEKNCQVFSPCPGAVCAFYDLGKKETMAVRAEMDALPMEEKTGLPFASRHPGKMHACGHDGHMAMALALGRHTEGAVRNLLLIFAPPVVSSAGWKIRSRFLVAPSVCCPRARAMAMWPSWPQACIFPGCREAKGRPVFSSRGRASISPRTAMVSAFPRS